MTTTFLL